MVQYSEQVHTFNAPLHFIALAHNLRFPSPWSTHVISSDVISRTFSPDGNIRTTRLILKRGKMPAWAPRAIYKISTTWVLEDSEVDLEREEGKEVRTRSRNIDHKNALEVWEWQTFNEKPGDRFATEATTLTRVTSEFGFWPIRHRIEKFGVGRVPKSSEKARAGLALIVSLLLSPTSAAALINSGPLNLYPFEPLPSSLALASELVRARFDEARAVVLRREEEERERRLSEAGEAEPGRVWRKKWRRAVKQGVGKFRERVCGLTGLLCEKREV